MNKKNDFVKQQLGEVFPRKMTLREEKIFRNTFSASRFGYDQCDIDLPENLREASANFPTIFKNIFFGGDDNGPFMKENVEIKKDFRLNLRKCH